MIEGRRGRAEARQHAGDVPECPGTKIGCISKISFPVIFRSLALNAKKYFKNAPKAPKVHFFTDRTGTGPCAK